MTLVIGSWYGYTIPAAENLVPPEASEYITLDKFYRETHIGTYEFDQPLLEATQDGEPPSYAEFIISYTSEAAPGAAISIRSWVFRIGGPDAGPQQEIEWDPGDNGTSGPFNGGSTFATLQGYPLMLEPLDRPFPVDWPRLWNWDDIVARTGFYLESAAVGSTWLDAPNDQPVFMRARPWFDIDFGGDPGSLALGSSPTGVLRGSRVVGRAE